MPSTKVTPKAEETGLRILDSALALFREEGFDNATMREIAQRAGVATGAAYYYYPSKEAIVMDFYQRACADMQPKIELALQQAANLEARLRELISVKLVHFAPNRNVLRALLRNGADPKYPLSPFSPQTKEIRDIDIAWFRRILVDCGTRIPRVLGAGLMYRAQSSRVATGAGVAMLLLLPPSSLTWDVLARPTLFKVHSAITIAASPELVWKHVITFSEMPEPQEWFFRAGLAYPKRARIVGTGPGAIRYCEFSTGPFVEPIEVWNEPRLLRFRVTENPAPMNEWSPYAQVLPKHLHGYLISKHGQFQLTRLPNNHTLLERTTWYQHGLWPGEYWRWWSDAIIHRIHLRVLDHIRTLAEKEGKA